MNVPASFVNEQFFWGGVKLQDGYLIPDIEKAIEVEDPSTLPEDALAKGAASFNVNNPVTSFVTGTSFLDRSKVFGPMGFRGDQTPNDAGFGIFAARLAY